MHVPITRNGCVCTKMERVIITNAMMPNTKRMMSIAFTLLFFILFILLLNYLFWDAFLLMQHEMFTNAVMPRERMR